MKTNYFGLLIGILLIGCSAPAAAIELAAPTETATPLPPAETSKPIEAPEPTFSLTPFQWTIEPIGSDIWRIFIIVRAEPMTVEQLGEFGGSLVWSETIIELCNNQEGLKQAGIDVRIEGEGFLDIGDGFESNWQASGCFINDDMADAFASYGVPDYACIFVEDIEGAKIEYCSPLKIFAGVRGMKTSGDSLWALRVNEIWRYKEGEWSFYAFVPGSSDHMAYLSDKLWAVENNRLQYFDGEQWQEIPGPIMGAYSIKADDESGILWVSTGENLYRWDVEEMSYIAHPRVPCCYLYELEVTGDGSVWAGGLYGYLPWVGGLARFDDAAGSWEMVRPWRAEEDVTPQLLATTPNGDLWVMLVDWSEDWGALQEAGEPFVEWALAYWDSASGEWTVFEQDLPEGYPSAMAADDGGVWLAQGSGFVEQMEFDGLAHFDGENWSHYLPGTNVFDVAVAPDGTIWYLTSDETLRQLQ
jgi:hypothetical protein